MEVRVEEKQKMHDVRTTRIHEYSQPAETRRDMDRKVVSFVEDPKEDPRTRELWRM